MEIKVKTRIIKGKGKNMRIEEYKFTRNGREISFDDFLLELRKQYRTEQAYIQAKEELIKKLENGIYKWDTASTTHLRIAKRDNICPLCSEEIIGYPSLSRRDNKTNICNKCGIIQAFEDFMKYQKENVNNEKTNNNRN